MLRLSNVKKYDKYPEMLVLIITTQLLNVHYEKTDQRTILTDKPSNKKCVPIIMRCRGNGAPSKICKIGANYSGL